MHADIKAVPNFVTAVLWYNNNYYYCYCCLFLHNCYFHYPHHYYFQYYYYCYHHYFLIINIMNLIHAPQDMHYIIGHALVPSNNKLLRKTNQNPVFLYISCTSCFQSLCTTQRSQFLDESTWCVYSQVIQITFQPLCYLLFQIPLVQYNHWNNSHDYCPHFSDFSGKNLIFFDLPMLHCSYSTTFWNFHI